MAVVTITDWIDINDGDIDNGLFVKLFSNEDTLDIKRFNLVTADGQLADGTAELTKPCNSMVVEVEATETDGAAKAGVVEPLAISRYGDFKIATALTVGTQILLANTTEGAAGDLVTAAGEEGDLSQVVATVIPDGKGSSTNNIIRFEPKTGAEIA